MYGPTETTIWSAAARIEPGSAPIRFGPPIANTQFYVLDRQSQPVPIGVPGELYIGGDGLARGYWNDPKLTSERFVPNPFRDDPQARLYRTGDLVRYHRDGTVEFLARLDTQVKVRGFRIETSEVESAILRYPGVRECVVVAADDPSGEKRLVAYLVTDMEFAPSELRRFLAARLADYMVPSIFMRIGSLPLTPNGKVNRKGLPEPDASATRSVQEIVDPRTPTERQLVRICSEVLGLQRLGIHDSLFDLGADSIHVFQIVARAKEANIALSPKQILEARTVGAICEGLSPSDFPAPLPASNEIVPVSRERYKTKRSRLT